jgi:hypothetical protein
MLILVHLIQVVKLLYGGDKLKNLLIGQIITLRF